MKKRSFKKKTMIEKEYRINGKVSLSQKFQIIFLKNHSLDKVSPHPWMRVRDIALKVGVKLNTCSTILRRWRLNGCDVSKIYEGRRRKRYLLTDDVIQWATSTQTLKQMQHLSSL